MNEYKKPYLHLFNQVTDAPEMIAKQDYISAERTLIIAQQECEELFIALDESPDQNQTFC